MRTLEGMGPRCGDRWGSAAQEAAGGWSFSHLEDTHGDRDQRLSNMPDVPTPQVPCPKFSGRSREFPSSH